MKKLMQKLENTFADAALLEMGVMEVFSPPTGRLTFAVALEETLVEVAFAEAADFDDIHEALQLEHYEIRSACFAH